MGRLDSENSRAYCYVCENRQVIARYNTPEGGKPVPGYVCPKCGQVWGVTHTADVAEWRMLLHVQQQRGGGQAMGLKGPQQVRMM